MRSKGIHPEREMGGSRTTRESGRAGGARCARSTHRRNTLRPVHPPGWPNALPHCPPHLHDGRGIARRIGMLSAGRRSEDEWPRLVTEELKFVRTERPTLAEFVEMPRPFHGLREL